MKAYIEITRISMKTGNIKRSHTTYVDDLVDFYNGTEESYPNIIHLSSNEHVFFNDVILFHFEELL